MIPSPYFGRQTSIEEELPPEQVQVDKTDIQSEAQPIPSNLFPSSHISGVFQIELPQISQWLMTPITTQFDSGDAGEMEQETHPSVVFAFPSSHYSVAALMPSPQVVTQVSLWVPEQVYPCSIAHVLEHPFPSAVPPSSHYSVRGFSNPFPQEEEHTEKGGAVVHVYPDSIKQVELHPFPLTVLPSSQVSVPSMAELPQT